MTPIVWEDLGMFSDCAFAGLGDAGLVGDNSWLSDRGWPRLQVRPSGLGMIYGKAEVDGLPVEIGRVGPGVVAARLEFTHDVAELDAATEGRWEQVGRLRIGRRGAVAVDAKHPHTEGWNHPLPLAAGWYRAEVFRIPDDHLGIRLIAEAVTAGIRGSVQA